MRRSLEIVFLTVVFVFTAAGTGIAQNELIFPLVVSTGPCAPNCEYWTSFTSVFNPNDLQATVTFTMYDSTGKVMGSSAAASASAFGTALVPPSVPLRTGWMKVTSSQPLIGLENLQFYRVSGGVQDLRSRIDLSPAPLTLRHFIRPESFGAIGVSIVFPNSADQSSTRGKLIHRDTDGSTLSVNELSIGPNQQLIAYLSDLLPGPPPLPPGPPTRPVQGSVEIVFDQPVAVTVLQFAASETLEEPVAVLAGDIPSQ
jgi:hypothetical protein